MKRFFYILFSLVVDVKNIAPSKEVQVVYTTDNWNTVNYARH